MITRERGEMKELQSQFGIAARYKPFERGWLVERSD